MTRGQRCLGMPLSATARKARGRLFVKPIFFQRPQFCLFARVSSSSHIVTATERACWQMLSQVSATGLLSVTDHMHPESRRLQTQALLLGAHRAGFLRAAAHVFDS